VTRSRRRTTYLIGAAVLVVALVGGRWLAVETVERAWDRTFAGGDALVQARVLGWLLQGLVLAFAIAWASGNLLIVYRAIGSVQMPRRLGDLEIVEAVHHRVLFGITVVLGVVTGALLSLGTGEWWRHALLASSPPVIGVADEVLGRDAGYYIGVLPWRAALQNRAMILTSGVLGLVALLYGLIGSVSIRRGRIRASDHARAHLAVLLACFALVIAWGAALDPAEVTAGLHGPVDQAALSVRVPGAIFVAAVAVITAIISLVWGWRDRPNLILAGWAALILSLAAGYIVIPGVVRASGTNEGTRLSRHRAELEREAFALADLTERAPPAFPSGEAAALHMPLWDPGRIAAASGGSAASIALLGVPAADRAYRPVWLVGPTAGRTAAPARLAAETDTGLAINPVRLADSAVLFLPGVHGTLVLSPDSGRAVRNAAIPVTGAWRRFALAWTIQSWDLLRGESADRLLLYRRDVTERLERLAPFARFGAPAPMVRDGGLWWVSWGYVSSELFPLARELPWRDGTTRYLRAGLIGAVRGGTGETHLWLAPGYDSLTAVWARHFRPLIEPAVRLPADLRARLAYPPEQFQIAVAQLERFSGGNDSARWTSRPNVPFQVVTPPGGEVWTGVGLVSRAGMPTRFEGILAGVVGAQRSELYFWSSSSTRGGMRLPGELLGSMLVKPGQLRIWPAGASVITMQAQFVEPTGSTTPPVPRLADVFVTLDGRSGRGPTALAALLGGSETVTDTSLAARYQRARRLAARADSALGAGDLERFGRLWRSLMRELAPAHRPR
jgi:hypothetical protein